MMSTGTIIAFECRTCFGVDDAYESVLVIALGENQNRAAEVECSLIGAVFGDSETAQLRGVSCTGVYPKFLSSPRGSGGRFHDLSLLELCSGVLRGIRLTGRLRYTFKRHRVLQV